MKPSTNPVSSKVRLGWIFLAAGIAAILGGLAIQFFNPAIGFNSQWISGLGILAVGAAIALLATYLPASRSAGAAARQINSETDERNLSIRNASGYTAFLAAIIANYGALFIYSALTRGIKGFDPIWVLLAFLSVFPLAVFIFFMVRNQQKM